MENHKIGKGECEACGETAALYVTASSHVGLCAECAASEDEIKGVKVGDGWAKGGE